MRVVRIKNQDASAFGADFVNVFVLDLGAKWESLRVLSSKINQGMALIAPGLAPRGDSRWRLSRGHDKTRVNLPQGSEQHKERTKRRIA